MCGQFQDQGLSALLAGDFCSVSILEKRGELFPECLDTGQRDTQSSTCTEAYSQGGKGGKVHPEIHLPGMHPREDWRKRDLVFHHAGLEPLV